MASLNRVFLIGNLTREPEIRYTPKGTPIAEICLAINRVTRDDDGQKREEVTFVDVTLWGRLAEIAEKYLRKGGPVFIEGRLQLDSWNDKQTRQKRYRLRVIGESPQLLGGRTEGKAVAQRQAAPRPQRQPAQTKSAPSAGQSKPPQEPALDTEPDANTVLAKE